MGLDERSRQRLEELGRRLPQPLPLPPQGGDRLAPGAGAAKRHAVETETDPQELFRQLMQASADGTVPPHLMDRLKQLEAAQRTPSPGPAAVPRNPRQPGRQRQGTAVQAHDPLYVAFEQLLLEDGESPES